MSQIKVVPLGAGQDVGRSCVLVTIGGKNIMFDCGMHMGYNDERRFPDFSYISRSGKFTQTLDCVIISHFHLDHCGALPYFTEVCGYKGPIYMTHPTKAICPILLEDYRKITAERKGEVNFFTTENVKDCMKKVIGVNLHETIQVDDELEIRAYYAGHVLGAAMFWARVNGIESVLYTGDYNMTPDRHLGAATIDQKLRPDLLITETTYATTIRGSKRMREANLLKKIHKTVAQGGKVLIPVFALGRAQELCILIETYWERMGLKVPVYFSAGMTEKANLYYELFINWTNQKIKDTFVQRNMFDFKHIKPLGHNNQEIDRPGPMVLFATPGMLHAGTSLDAFKKWCGSDLNTCILPGFCVAGTVGSKVLSGKKTIVVDNNTTLNVRCAIESLSFSAHADSKGILQLIQQAEPKNVMLVHGEKHKMALLKEKIIADFKIPVFDPANGEVVLISTCPPIKADLSTTLLKRQFFPQSNNTQNDYDYKAMCQSQECLSWRIRDLHQKGSKASLHHNKICSCASVVTEALALIKKIITQVYFHKNVSIFDPSEGSHALGLNTHKLLFQAEFDLPPHLANGVFIAQLLGLLAKNNRKHSTSHSSGTLTIHSNSVSVKIVDSAVLVTWEFEDETIASDITSLLTLPPPSVPSTNTPLPSLSSLGVLPGTGGNQQTNLLHGGLPSLQQALPSLSNPTSPRYHPKSPHEYKGSWL